MYSSLFVRSDGSYGCRQPMHALAREHCEAEITTDRRHGCQQDPIFNRSGTDDTMG